MAIFYMSEDIHYGVNSQEIISEDILLEALLFSLLPIYSTLLS